MLFYIFKEEFKLNKQIIGIFVCTILIATAFSAIVTVNNGYEQVDQQHSIDCWTGLLSENWRAQSFKPTYDMLTKVSLRIVTWDSKLLEDNDVTMLIKHSLDGEVLASAIIVKDAIVEGRND